MQEYGLQDAVIAVAEQEWPRWTDRSPRYPSSDPTTAERAPIDIIAGLFLSAFDLPCRCFNYIRWYISTGDEAFLEVGANPLEVKIDAPICSDGRVRVRSTIDGLDSATTKADWMDLWDQRIAPFLKAVYINEVQSDRWQGGEELGGTHLDDLMRRGRQGHRSGMKTPEYARFYEFFLNQHLTGDLEEALTDYVTAFPEDPFVNGETDLRTLKTNVDRLENIMRPRTKIA